MPLLIMENLRKHIYKLNTLLNILKKLACCFGILVYSTSKYTFNLMALLNMLYTNIFPILFL